jgi:hypothetical protein
MGSAMSERSERRQTPRRTEAAAHGVLGVRIRPGHAASLLDISCGGAAIETTQRLLPGTLVELQLETQHRRACARGRIARCAVVSVEADRLSYRAAVCFEESIATLLSQTTEKTVPDPD